jgi:AcrR family transcriptional regulator
VSLFEGVKGRIAMVTKGDKTREALLNTAKALFSEKGYSAVTMKDFCDRQGLSRGGLYRHFASTKEIFIAMLDADKENSLLELEKAISAGISARELFLHFLKIQKQEVQQAGGRLSVAVYEFCTSNPDQKTYLDDRFQAAVETLEKLIRYGQARQEFRAGNAKATASHLVVFLEGFKLSSAVISLSEAMIEQQLHYLYEMVVI